MLTCVRKDSQHIQKSIAWNTREPEGLHVTHFRVLGLNPAPLFSGLLGQTCLGLVLLSFSLVLKAHSALVHFVGLNTELSSKAFSVI